MDAPKDPPHLGRGSTHKTKENRIRFGRCGGRFRLFCVLEQRGPRLAGVQFQSTDAGPGDHVPTHLDTSELPYSHVP